MEYKSHFKENTTLILLGAGDSSRFCSQSNLPKKQWLRSGCDPLWLKVLNKFICFGFNNIFLTASDKECFFMQNYTSYPIVCGGKTRTQSILNALKEVITPYVLISDIARYNPQEEVINSLFKALSNDPTLCCVAPYLPVVDTTFCSKNGYLNRDHLKQIQTPQLSKTQILKKALQNGDFGDESSAITALGEKVGYILGSPLMNKLTYSYELSSLTLPPPDKMNFVGQGIDIHAFTPNKPMVLGGVQLPYDFGFKAHSDGDVLLHSITDAILGAIGAGDIGEWFPDTQENFKNADSKLLLKEVFEFSRAVGYEIINLDLSILAQTPKISPHKDAIKSSLSTLLHLPKHAINIKATTGEEMGFVGRGEGVCVISCVNMQFIDWSKQ
ncbi:bifunctional 2-C-methyl-D-erythritol 4-phosphate cytidylyltransferase/2-C-methyl-D-erythritol 2,4-cyclodiphosphate synthase [Helicobacter cholecystus]|uniref:bifunctional 2-C-methyl-D-erythritol 4-phosphate cytidylyltransferase/2-C-methyl-D-erythritol 2,4-cyclodiphosphate synthase n=1 Tax=Helicobacter cholecystus TaxID=45498 RepID=UPI0027381D09|nr:bifunctional 2-C-methyl-D-erythritol 4-phosphate cytidylyltransferase/2-C-methyl-D-erythritol 2,4-cyclodiphosphate synthase [Helicobacter cholecystus]